MPSPGPGYNYVALRELRINNVIAFEPGQWVPDSTIATQGWVVNTDISAPGAVVPTTAALTSANFSAYLDSNYQPKLSYTSLPTTGIVLAHRASGVTLSGLYQSNAPVAPQEARSAIRLAAANPNVHIIDVDLQRTSDGVLVVAHDDSISTANYPNGTGLISTTPFAQLPLIDQTVIVGAGWAPEPFMTAEELIREFGGRKILNIEPKDSSDIPYLAGVIKKYGAEKSVFINCNYTSGNIATIVAAGCLASAWNVTSVADIQGADAAGVSMVMLTSPITAQMVTACQSATNIKRWIADEVSRRTQLAALPSGVQGYTSDAIGYLDGANYRQDIALEQSNRKIGIGWWNNGVYTDTPLFDSNGAVGLSSSSHSVARMIGSMCGPKPATYKVVTRYKITGATADTQTRPRLRVCCTSDEGTNNDTDTRGYTYSSRVSGQMQIWSAPVGYGAPTILDQVNYPALTDGGEYELTFYVTPTTVALEMSNQVAATLSAGLTAGVAITSLPVNALVSGFAANAKFRLPNGDWVKASGSCANGATSIPIQSYTPAAAVASGTNITYGLAPITNNAWRGDYMWLGGSAGGTTNHPIVVTAYSWA